MISLRNSILFTYSHLPNLAKSDFPLNQFALRRLLTQRSFLASLTANKNAEERKALRPMSEMPRLQNFPFFGSFFQLIFRKDFNTSKFHVLCHGLCKDYGPLFVMFVPFNPPFVYVSNPDDIETVFRVTMNNPFRDSFHSLKKIRDDAVDNYFEKKGGLLTENNEEWRRVRSRVQTPMLKPRNIYRYIPEMDKVTLDFMNRIASLQKEHGEMPPNFQQELQKWALESISLVALNKRLGCLEPNLAVDSTQMKLISTVNSILRYLNTTELNVQWWRIFPSPTFRKLRAGHDFVLRIADEHVREVEEKLKLQKAKGSDEERELSLMEMFLLTDGLSRKDVLTFILDMLLAGIDSTAHAMAFTLYLLARNPSAQRKLQEEIDSVLGDGTQTITEAHLAKFSYLKGCIKESLRVFPLVPGSLRILTEDAVIGGYLIPKGHQIFTVSSVAGKNEATFPRPNEFLPERWGRDQPLGPIHPFASLPFSHGPRMCIGRRIAEQEMYIFLARVMHRFKVDYKYKDIEMLTRIVSAPTEPLRFEFTERR